MYRDDDETIAANEDLLDELRNEVSRSRSSPGSQGVEDITLSASSELLDELRGATAANATVQSTPAAAATGAVAAQIAEPTEDIFGELASSGSSASAPKRRSMALNPSTGRVPGQVDPVAAASSDGPWQAPVPSIAAPVFGEAADITPTRTRRSLALAAFIMIVLVVAAVFAYRYFDGGSAATEDSPPAVEVETEGANS